MPPQKNQPRNFFWTDDEVQLLSNTVKDCKSKKLYDDGLGWDSVKDKYFQIIIY